MDEYEVWVDPIQKRYESSAALVSAASKVSREAVTLETLKALAGSKEETELELRDVKSLEQFRVKAIIASNPEELPGSNLLWPVGGAGRYFKEPWGIKIVERITEVDGEVTVLPERRLSLAERKGRILVDLLKEREEKMKKKGG